MNYKIDNKQEIYDSLVYSFKDQAVGKKDIRKEVAKQAKTMKDQLKSSKDLVTKEYIEVLNKIIKDYSAKRSIEQLEDDYKKSKWSKK